MKTYCLDVFSFNLLWRHCGCFLDRFLELKLDYDWPFSVLFSRLINNAHGSVLENAQVQMFWMFVKSVL